MTATQNLAAAESSERRSSPNIWLICALLMSLISIGIHTYLTNQHFKLHFGLMDSQSICNVNETFNCDTVASSVYSSFWGVPMALWGAVTHLIFSLLTIIVLTGLNSEPSRLKRYAWGLSAFVATTSLVMGSISLFALRAYCIMCMICYALSFFMIFFMTKSLDKNWAQELTEDFKDLFSGSKWVAIHLVMIPVLALFFNKMATDSFGGAMLKERITDSLTDWHSGTAYNFNLEQGIKHPARTSAKMTIVEFADFLCPHCKHAGPGLAAFTQSHDDVEMIFKTYPLDGTCNGEGLHKGDGLRCQLAYAAYCSESKFKKGQVMQHLIFENQAEWSLGNYKDKLKELTGQQKISFEELDKCMTANETHEAVMAMAKEGGTANVHGTPSIFVNGKLLPGGQFIPVLNAVYNSL